MANGKKTETPATPAATETPAVKPPRKKKEPVDPNETPAGRFARLGKTRALKAQSAIANVGKLTGRGYESTPEQRAKIVKLLSDALETAKARLNNEASGGGENFTL